MQKIAAIRFAPSVFSRAALVEKQSAAVAFRVAMREN
jgi:hypothetical protein